MAVAGQISCMVHTTGLPLRRILRILLSDSIPWFIQCRWMMSASWNSRMLVMSVPALAISISNRCCLLKCRWQNTTSRSHKKCQRFIGDLGRGTTVRVSLSFSRTSILAFTPLLLRAFIRRLAATAAPPVRSLVFTINTFMGAKIRISAKKTKCYLSFLEREYLRAKLRGTNKFC